MMVILAETFCFFKGASVFRMNFLLHAWTEINDIAHNLKLQRYMFTMQSSI